MAEVEREQEDLRQLVETEFNAAVRRAAGRRYEPDMNAKAPISLDTWGQMLSAMWRLAVAIIGALSVAVPVFVTVGWYVFEPRIAPYIVAMDRLLKLDFDALEAMPQAVARITALEQQVPAVPLIEFQGRAEVSPVDVRGTESIAVTYTLRRRFACPAKVTARFYSLDRGGYDSTYTYEFDAIRAPVTNDFQPFTIIIRIPEGMTAGRWGYAPEITPYAPCQSISPVFPPRADFTVTPGEEVEQ